MRGRLTGPGRGFTLVSTILTAVLICLLAGLLAVAAWTARGAAERAICTGNLRALANALIMYRSEHDDYPPASYEVCNASGAVRQVTWAEVVAPLLDKKNAFVCPCDYDRRPSRKRRAAAPPVSSTSYEYVRGEQRVGLNPAGTRRGAVAPGGQRTVQRGAPLLVCQRHQPRGDHGRRRVLVAYDDGSVRWELAADQPSSARAAAPAPRPGRQGADTTRPAQSRGGRPSSPR